MAAYNAGAKTVLIPADNERDLAEIDALARENLKFIPCRKIADVLKQALLPAVPEILSEASEDAVAASKFIPASNVQTNQIHFKEN